MASKVKAVGLSSSHFWPTTDILLKFSITQIIHLKQFYAKMVFFVDFWWLTIDFFNNENKVKKIKENV